MTIANFRNEGRSKRRVYRSLTQERRSRNRFCADYGTRCAHGNHYFDRTGNTVGQGNLRRHGLHRFRNVSDTIVPITWRLARSFMR